MASCHHHDGPPIAWLQETVDWPHRNHELRQTIPPCKFFFRGIFIIVIPKVTNTVALTGKVGIFMHTRIWVSCLILFISQCPTWNNCFAHAWWVNRRAKESYKIVCLQINLLPKLKNGNFKNVYNVHRSVSPTLNVQLVWERRVVCGQRSH